MSKIFDREDETNEFMEMPCRCDCGKWFDLNDGYASEREVKEHFKMKGITPSKSRLK